MTRRELLGRGSVLTGSSALAWGLGPASVRAAFAALGEGALRPDEAAALAEVLAPFIADVSGDGTTKKADEKIVRKALRARRGLDVVPREGYDYRADVFARGAVDRNELKAVKAAISYYADNPDMVVPRPITVGWHYGWYNHANRPVNKQHVWYTGGGYSSRSPQTEAAFNDLKNEFGISVDALSWADPKTDGNLNENLEVGYQRAGNAGTRYAALLYESLISLRAKPGERIDFERVKTRNRLIGHFRDMGRWMRQLRKRSKARVFTIDGKPVIFIYASHTWGSTIDAQSSQYDRIDEAVANARIAFGEMYGAEPYLVGEEMTFGLADTFAGDRVRRAANFDAVFVYHHATGADFIVQGGRNLRGPYVDQVRRVLANTYAGAMENENRFTGKKLLVIPSLAAGFSKDKVPTLFANRADYADFLKEMIRFHREEYLVPAFGAAEARNIAPIVSVGAWNEEWEGHSVFPSKFNKTLSPRTQKGFDYVMAIKQAFGWNHYSQTGLPRVDLAR